MSKTWAAGTASGELDRLREAVDDARRETATAQAAIDRVEALLDDEDDVILYVSDVRAAIRGES